ncbi:MAG: MoaD/ThiS family protein [Gemmatimonadota bacterium]
MRAGEEPRPPVRVLLFGQARELAGTGEHLLALEGTATVARAAELLGRAYPAVAPLLERCSFAVDRTYARREELLRPGDELAVIPPIGGG